MLPRPSPPYGEGAKHAATRRNGARTLWHKSVGKGQRETSNSRFGPRKQRDPALLTRMSTSPAGLQCAHRGHTRSAAAKTALPPVGGCVSLDRLGARRCRGGTRTSAPSRASATRRAPDNRPSAPRDQTPAVLRVRFEVMVDTAAPRVSSFSGRVRPLAEWRIARATSVCFAATATTLGGSACLAMFDLLSLRGDGAAEHDIARGGGTTA